MNIAVRTHKDIVIVEPCGRITVETEDLFAEVIRELLNSGTRRLVLNLAGVPYIDSCGLGAVAQAYVSAWRRGGDLKLLHLTGRNRQLFKVTKLDTVFEVFDTEDEAERSFATNNVDDARSPARPAEGPPEYVTRLQSAPFNYST